MIRVLIVDDQEIMRQGLKMILGQEPDLEVVGTAGNGEEAIAFCRMQEQPDVVLMDIQMPVMNGVEATKALRAFNPEIRVVILTTFHDDAYIFDSLREGAHGYLLKDAPPETIARSIRAVYEGGAMIQPEIASRVIRQFNKMQDGRPLFLRGDKEKLTKREKEICLLIAHGLNNREIAKDLFLSEGTVKNHVTRILDKLDLRDRTQLAIYTLYEA
jgi:DNA-binding NarL/FixJ family response regulator